MSEKGYYSLFGIEETNKIVHQEMHFLLGKLFLDKKFL